MAVEPEGVDWGVGDLREVLRVGLSRGSHLLAAGEVAVVERILALDGAPARLYTRLLARVPEAFAIDTLAGVVDDVGGALDALADADLVDGLVPWSVRAAESTVAELKDACRRLGLPVSGRHAELVARLAGRGGWSERRWVRVRHRALVRRLERWAFLRTRLDRSALVVERLGHLRWPVYPLTPGPALHRDRADLLAWEAVRDALPELAPDACVAWMATPAARAPGGLDLRGRLAERALEGARDLERAGRAADARAVYRALLADGAARPGLAVRIARTLEAEGRAREALAELRAARRAAEGGDRVAIARAGRRVARQLGEGWAPDPPLRAPPERTFTLSPAPPDGPRPRWTTSRGDEVVEDALITALADAGRAAVHGEGALWTTLFALLFADAYFLPVSGALPARLLPGPLDVGTPAFAARREDAVAEVLAAVAAGEAPDRVRVADARWRGVVLAGAAWGRCDGDTLARIAAALGPVALGCVLDRLLREGWSAARGLADLVVLDGPPVTLPARPARLAAAARLVEVKGPGDTVRDDQAAWFDRLLAAGVPVELWRVEPRDRTHPTGP